MCDEALQLAGRLRRQAEQRQAGAPPAPGGVDEHCAGAHQGTPEAAGEQQQVKAAPASAMKQEEGRRLAQQQQQQQPGGQADGQSKRAQGPAGMQAMPSQQMVADKAEAAAAEAAGSAALAHTFVGAMRRLNHCRWALEAAGAVPLLACPRGSPEAALSLHCAQCQQLCYAATAVLQPAGEPAIWRHLCLECAAAALPGTPPAAAGAGQPASEQQQRHGGSEAAAALPPLLFVKPCWGELEACAQQLEREGLPNLSSEAGAVAEP